MPPPTDQVGKEQTECINLVEPEEEVPEDIDIGMDGAPQVALPQPNLDPAQWLQREERPSKEELRGPSSVPSLSPSPA